MKKIILIGAGGHCVSCIDVIEMQRKFKIVGLIDNKKKNFLLNYKIIGNDGKTLGGRDAKARTHCHYDIRRQPWKQEEVWDYLRKHDVPYNPLHDAGYPSIGCEPCTAQVQVGQDERAGRWQGREKTECGLHEGAPSPVVLHKNKT